MGVFCLGFVFFPPKALRTCVSLLWVRKSHACRQIILWPRAHTSLNSYWIYWWRWGWKQSTRKTEQEFTNAEWWNMKMLLLVKAFFFSVQTDSSSSLMPCWTIDSLPYNDMNNDVSTLLHCQILESLRREETTEVSSPTFAQQGAQSNDSTEFRPGHSGLCHVRSWKPPRMDIPQHLWTTWFSASLSSQGQFLT